MIYHFAAYGKWNNAPIDTELKQGLKKGDRYTRTLNIECTRKTSNIINSEALNAGLSAFYEKLMQWWG